MTPCDVCGLERPLVAYWRRKFFMCQVCVDGRIRRRLAELITKGRTERELASAQSNAIAWQRDGVDVDLGQEGFVQIKVKRAIALAEQLQRAFSTGKFVSIEIGGKVFGGRIVQRRRERAGGRDLFVLEIYAAKDSGEAGAAPTK